MLVSDLDLPELDYFAPDLKGPRFHEVMRELAQDNWLARGHLGYFALDREAGDFFLRSRQTTFPGMKVAEVFGVEDGALREQIDRNILHLHGDAHRRLRGLVNPAFTPKAAERFRPAMREFIAELFGRVEEHGRCEAVADICKPYPAMTIATVMGAPLEDAGRLAEWSNWIQKQFAADFHEHRGRIEIACQELYAYLHDLLARRRGEPGGDDVISTLIAVEQEGDRLNDSELVNLVLNALVGGVDTTQSQLAHALRLFAGHPDQWQMLAERAELVPAAVEEVLRYEPITPFTARICLEDVEYRDVTFPRDTVVMVSTFSANHQGHEDSFDLTADRGNAKPLTFGAGTHYCLGANLARAELQEALAHLAPRMPGLALDGEPAFESIHGIYGLTALPLRWG